MEADKLFEKLGYKKTIISLDTIIFNNFKGKQFEFNLRTKKFYSYIDSRDILNVKKNYTMKEIEAIYKKMIELEVG